MTMATFTVEVPDEEERGVRVGCEDHDEWEEFPPGLRSGTFHCSGCSFEVEVGIHDLLDWRDWGERC